MKKLLAALFTLALALSIAAPVFAQDTGSQEAPKADNSMKKEKKMKKSHAKKEKKMKKDKMEKPADTTTPPQK